MEDLGGTVCLVETGFETLDWVVYDWNILEEVFGILDLKKICLTGPCWQVQKIQNLTGRLDCLLNM